MGVAVAPIVLVVEDEPIIRLAAVDIVESAGFIAIEAANADEAIRILESRTDIRIVFTDVNMPGSIDGLKLARAVRHRWPPVKIVVVSGLIKLAPDDLPLDTVFLPKPYRSSQITQAFHDLLAS